MRVSFNERTPIVVRQTDAHRPIAAISSHLADVRIVNYCSQFLEELSALNPVPLVNANPIRSMPAEQIVRIKLRPRLKEAC
jgi:hypothetical protein